MSGCPTYTLTLQNDSLGDFATQYWQQEDWQRWQTYLADLDAKGIRGQQHTLRITTSPHPAFDQKLTGDVPLESYRFLFLDLSTSDGQPAPDQPERH